MLLEAYLVWLRATLPITMRALPMRPLLRGIAMVPISASETRARKALSRAERAARRLGLANTCLYRAMVRFVAYRRAGLAVRFCLGVSRDDPDTGHAWVEYNGAPVDEDPRPELIVTFAYP